ncbi:MAG: hypothetical protein V2G34_02560 [bacterium JZ-2024 1]
MSVKKEKKRRGEEPLYTNIGGALNIFIPTAYLKVFQRMKEPLFSLDDIVKRAMEWGEKNVERPRRRMLLKELRKRMEKRRRKSEKSLRKKPSGGGGI